MGNLQSTQQKQLALGITATVLVASSLYYAYSKKSDRPETANTLSKQMPKEVKIVDKKQTLKPAVVAPNPPKCQETPVINVSKKKESTK